MVVGKKKKEKIPSNRTLLTAGNSSLLIETSIVQNTN